MMKVTMKTKKKWDMGVAVIGDLIFFSSLVVGMESGVVGEVEVMNTKTQTMETLTRNPTRKKRIGSWSG